MSDHDNLEIENTLQNLYYSNLLYKFPALK